MGATGPQTSRRSRVTPNGAAPSGAQRSEHQMGLFGGRTRLRRAPTQCQTEEGGAQRAALDDNMGVRGGQMGLAHSYRLMFGLTAAATVSCFVTAAWMTTIPFMTGGRLPTVGEALAMVAVPAVAAAVASWAAWSGRRWLLVAATAVVGLFALVTGFSIGDGFLPTLGLLVWAVIASIDAGPRRGDADTAV